MFDELRSVRAAVDALACSFDARALSGADALRAVDELGAIARVIEGLLGCCAKRVDDSGVHETRGDRSAASLVGRTLGVPAGEVRNIIDTAAKLERLPATAAAVRDGRLSPRQARTIAEAATANPGAEPELLAAAVQGLVPLRDACIAARAAVEDPAARRARQQRLRYLRSWIDEDGMVAGRFRLPPERGGQVRAVLDAEQQRIFRGHRTGRAHEPLEAYGADALCNLVLNGGAGSGIKVNLHVVVDHSALVRGRTLDGEVCEIPGVGPVDVAWARELVGEAFLSAIVKRGKDITTVAHLGRHVPAEIQTALLVSGRECDVEDCHVRGYLERDHHHDHALGGPTSFANLGWLCYAHHRLKSNGWQLGPPDATTRKRKLRPPPSRAA